MGRRFFRHGELHLVLLALLSDRALHGYELMGQLERLFGPAYRASPGSVYPALKALAAEGLVAVEAGSDPVRYRSTSAGQQAVADRRHELVRLEERTGARFATTDEVERALGRVSERVRSLGGRVDPAPVVRVLHAAAEQLEDLDPHPVKG